MDNIYLITEKKIDLSVCKVLYQRPFSQESITEDFDCCSGQWSVDEDGWLTGYHNENSGGMMYSKQEYPGDIIMEFDAKTVGPCDNDLNFVFKTCGWDDEKKDAGRGYIAGLGGWWLNRAGIEKYPECKLRVLTSLCPLESGKLYHIVAGCIQGHCFLFANSQLVIEMTDPEYDSLNDCNKFGFGTYASHIKYRNFVLYQAAYQVNELAYEV